jgi:hypothetical protein
MNAMLVSGGYPWTVIRVEDRAYLSALDRGQHRYADRAVREADRGLGHLVDETSSEVII